MAKKRAAKKKKPSNFIVRFFRETIGELRKVSWPSRSEALQLTRTVIIVLTIMTIILGTLDWLFTLLFRQIFG